MDRTQNIENRGQNVESSRAKALSTFYSLSSTVSSRGFTLIETLVAIAVLVTAIAGPLTIASKGLQSALLAKDQLTASFLAQEGIEYIREVRDNNCLQGGCTDSNGPVAGVWLTGLSSCITTSCTVDATSQLNPAITACPGNVCPPLRYNDASSFYTYSLTDPVTNFTRSIQITPTPDVNGHEATITSTVTWTTGFFTRQIVLSEVISDWQ